MSSIDILKTLLCTKSSVLTENASSESEVAYDTRESIFRNIGLGSCGSVFEVPGTQVAYKKGTKYPDVFRDFILTNKVHKSAANIRRALQENFRDLTLPNIPRCYEFHSAADENFWDAKINHFPEGYRSKQPLFSVEHISPLPTDGREALIELYFDDDEGSQREAKDDPDNKDCLVRLYLGERESLSQQSGAYDTLRNFPLRLNMIEDLDLEANHFAKEMALGLAVIHWQAQIDGMDMEFVLGSSTMSEREPLMSANMKGGNNFNSERRRISMWILDFDKASEFELTEIDVKTKLVPAFLGNDPYYPRPDVDIDLWEAFCETYLHASEFILRSREINHPRTSLPKNFLDEVSKTLKENKDWSVEHNIVFAASNSY